MRLLITVLAMNVHFDGIYMTFSMLVHATFSIVAIVIHLDAYIPETTQLARLNQYIFRDPGH